MSRGLSVTHIMEITPHGETLMHYRNEKNYLEKKLTHNMTLGDVV